MLQPDLEDQFNRFYHAAYAEGELDAKTKALIGLAVSMTAGCSP